jgi:hypothetical protein
MLWLVVAVKFELKRKRKRKSKMVLLLSSVASLFLIQAYVMFSQKRWCHSRMQNKEHGSGKRLLKDFKTGKICSWFLQYILWMLWFCRATWWFSSIWHPWELFIEWKRFGLHIRFFQGAKLAPKKFPSSHCLNLSLWRGFSIIFHAFCGVICTMWSCNCRAFRGAGFIPCSL